MSIRSKTAYEASIAVQRWEQQRRDDQDARNAERQRAGRTQRANGSYGGW